MSFLSGVQNFGYFSRFLEAVSFSHASPLNITNIAGECEIGRKAAEGYIGILEDILLGFRLPVFRKRAQRTITKTPKFYLFDTGVYRALRPAGPLDRPAEIDGCALEGLVAQHLRAWLAYSRKKWDMYFWRTPSGVEVDFIIYGSSGFWAIEVKNASKVRPADLKALKSFKKDYPEAVALLLYRGSERLLKDDILCLPCSEFLRHIYPDRLLDDHFKA